MARSSVSILAAPCAACAIENQRASSSAKAIDIFPDIIKRMALLRHAGWRDIIRRCARSISLRCSAIKSGIEIASSYARGGKLITRVSKRRRISNQEPFSSLKTLNQYQAIFRLYVTDDGIISRRMGEVLMPLGGVSKKKRKYWRKS